MRPMHLPGQVIDPEVGVGPGVEGAVAKGRNGFVEGDLANSEI